ncbi:MAG: tetratricopeptide repeat protein [Magnetococcales bacterium]|nr:tetratricopeptide repeat protein [Magnetococcales bacterium]MBF0151508.1 tetratricopeptide repeat protein [Magnetococcales bacterium]MBF0631741.1 tetratricopeptide repeat protein [Magnetococcales bacterium]
MLNMNIFFNTANNRSFMFEFRIHFTLLIMFLSGWPLNGGAEDLYHPTVVFAYACDLEKQGDHVRAATEFGRYVAFVRNTPDQESFGNRLEEAMFRLAVNLSQAKEFNAALLAFSDLGATFPKTRYLSQALLRMGYIYEMNGSLEEAQSRYQQLIDLGLDAELSSLASLRLAWLALDQPDMEQRARQHLRTASHARHQEHAHVMSQTIESLSRLPYKDPWLAGVSSAIIPGAGHWYLERPRDAAFALLSNGLLLLGTQQAFEQRISGLGVALAIIELGWYSGTVFSAVSLTHKYNRQLRHDHLNKIGMFLNPDSQAIGLTMAWQY